MAYQSEAKWRTKAQKCNITKFVSIISRLRHCLELFVYYWPLCKRRGDDCHPQCLYLAAHVGDRTLLSISYTSPRFGVVWGRVWIGFHLPVVLGIVYPSCTSPRRIFSPFSVTTVPYCCRTKMAADSLKEGVVLPVLCRLVNLPPARMCHGQFPHKLTCLACF